MIIDWITTAVIVGLALISLRCGYIADAERVRSDRDLVFVWAAAGLGLFLMIASGLLFYHAIWRI